MSATFSYDNLTTAVIRFGRSGVSSANSGHLGRVIATLNLKNRRVEVNAPVCCAE